MLKQPIGAYEAILCDLDGCLIAGDRVMPGAREFLRRHHDRLWIVSNNSTDTQLSLARRLASLDIAVHPDRIALAGTVAVDEIARRNPRPRLTVFGTGMLRAYAVACGLPIDDASPECILLGRDLDFDLRALKRLIALVSDGIPLVVTNEDATHPDADGRPTPETGAIVAALRYCIPSLGYECFGKPHAAIYTHVLSRSGTVPGRALAIGDNPSTDGAGARNANIDFALVGPQSRHFSDIGALIG